MEEIFQVSVPCAECGRIGQVAGRLPSEDIQPFIDSLKAVKAWYCPDCIDLFLLFGMIGVRVDAKTEE